MSIDRITVEPVHALQHYEAKEGILKLRRLKDDRPGQFEKTYQYALALADSLEIIVGRRSRGIDLLDFHIAVLEAKVCRSDWEVICDMASAAFGDAYGQSYQNFLAWLEKKYSNP